MTITNKSGFSLLELMIALTILMVSILAISGLHGRALKESGRSHQIYTAVQLARMKMNEKIIELEAATDRGEFPDASEEKGQFDEHEDFWWKMKIEKVEVPPVPSLGEGQAGMEQFIGYIGEQLETMIRLVTVTIYWEEIGSEQSYDVSTHIANIKTGNSVNTTTSKRGES